MRYFAVFMKQKFQAASDSLEYLSVLWRDARYVNFILRRS